MDEERNSSNCQSQAVLDPQASGLNNLMSSIQNKLSMLACQDSIQQFQISKIGSPKRELLTATDQKRKQPRMFIHDLQIETSKRKVQRNEEEETHEKTNGKVANFGESQIISRINEIEHFYMDKLQYSSHRISTLQYDNQQLLKQCSELQLLNQRLTASLNVKESADQQKIDKKIKEIKEQLIKKFSNQAEQHFQQHLKEMKSLTEELSQQKHQRRCLQHQIALLKTQKTNLQNFYRDLLHDHRQMIRIDIATAHKYNDYQKNDEKWGSEVKKHQSISSSQEKTKKKKKAGKKYGSKGPHKSKGEDDREYEVQMSKEEMIPYLAKGIQELKDKLKFK